MTGWLSGWQYRKSHEIVGSTAGAQANYQVLIIVHYESGTDYNDNTKTPPEGHVYVGGKSRADFQDIRFTKSDGVTELDYWFENEKTAEADGYGVFWVEVDSIPASPDTTQIYIYYGNPSATTTSSGENTFIFFDDFNDLTKWDILAGSPSVSDSIVTLQGDGIELKSAYAVTSPNKRVRAYGILHTDTYYARWCSLRQSGSLSNRIEAGVRERYSPYHKAWTAKNDSHTYTAVTLIIGSWHTQMFTWTSDKVDFFYNDSLVATHTTNIPTGDPPLELFMRSAGNNPKIQVDWIWIANFVDPEPSHGAWGSEETAPPVVVETIVAKTFPMLYLSKPATAQELISKVEGATVKHVAKDYPEKLIKEGKAKELRSKFSS